MIKARPHNIDFVKYFQLFVGSMDFLIFLINSLFLHNHSVPVQLENSTFLLKRNGLNKTGFVRIHKLSNALPQKNLLEFQHKPTLVLLLNFYNYECQLEDGV